MRYSKIEWCHHTLNFWWGCTKVSPACTHCYAATLDAMRGPLFDEGRVHWGINAPRWVKVDSATRELRRLAKSAIKRGVRERIFINSMSDTFEDHAQLPPAREILFAEIVKHTQFDFLLLTKRPENIGSMVPVEWQLPDKWPAHVWVGTTVENQEYAEKRIPKLLSVPAKVRFLSCEPLLEPIDLEYPPGIFGIEGPRTCCSGYDCGCQGKPVDPPLLYGIDWVICGGESGAGCRPMDPMWSRSLRNQCEGLPGVAFFMKQMGGVRDKLGEVDDLPQDLRIRQFPGEAK